jgi:uncharacterized membrane protein YbhN (UPF0104 family)
MGFVDATVHALRLIAERVVSVNPWWLLLGVVLFELQQAVRTRGWFTIIRAAYPSADGLRARNVCGAYLAGSGLNAVVPARLGDVLKLWLVRRRVDGGRWSTLAATLLPETLFDVVASGALVIWALSAGLLPLPVSSTELPTVDVSLVMRRPLETAGVVLAIAVVVWCVRRWDPRRIVRRLRQGLAILHRPRLYLTGVVPWQALARIIRLCALAAWMQAFHLPVTVASVLLVMAAQGGGRIIPLAPASAGLRLAMLSYGFAQVTEQPVDIAAITAFQVGVGAAQLLGSLAVGAVALACELGTLSPRALVDAVRQARAAGGPRRGRTSAAVANARTPP